jgi:hypothetical protein
MGLDEARRVLKGQHGSIDRLGPAYVEYAYACATLVDHYKEHPEQMRPGARVTRDTGVAREMTKQQNMEAAMKEGGWFKWTDAAAVGTPAGQASPGGATPGAVASGKSGSTLRMKLPHAGFYISQSYDENGDPFIALFEGPDPNVARANTMQTEVQDRQVRARYEYEAVKARTQLQNMNAKNRAFWQKHERRA